MSKLKQNLSSSSLDLDLLIPYITSLDNPTNPSIDLNKLDYILKDFSITFLFIY